MGPPDDKFLEEAYIFFNFFIKVNESKDP